MSLLRNLVENRSITDKISEAIEMRGGGDAAVPVTSTTALQHTAVYACVRVIAEGVAGLPAHSYVESQDRTFRERVNPQPKLLTNPHRDLTTFEWRRQILVSMLTYGNAFGLITERDRRGWPTQITILDPNTVTVSEHKGTWIWKLNNRPIRLHQDGGDLVHFPAFQMPGSLLGLSPIQVAARSIGVGLAAERFASNWFKDGAAPSSILTSEKALDDPESRRLQAKFAAAHGSQSRFPAVLSGGVTWQPITITPEESQFLATQQFSVSQIARLYGVPPHMIGDVERSTSWGSGIEQQSIGYVTHTLSSWNSMLDGRMTQLRPRTEYVRTDVNGLLRSDSKTRFESYVQARMAGWLSVNEIRAMEEREPVEGGEGYIQPLNMGPLGSNPLNPDTPPDQGPAA